MPNPAKFEEKSMKKVGSFPDHSWDGFFIDFGTFWLQVGSQNGAKIDARGGRKKKKKMMMTRMVKNWI